MINSDPKKITLIYIHDSQFHFAVFPQSKKDMRKYIQRYLEPNSSNIFKVFKESEIYKANQHITKYTDIDRVLKLHDSDFESETDSE